MTAKGTVYVDMDDVLCETGRGLIALLSNEFGKRVAFEDVHEFDLGKSFGLSPDELEVFLERFHNPDVLNALAPMKGARETLAAWSDGGYGIAVMTGRPPSTRMITENWLANHEFPYDSLQFVDKYGRFDHDPSFGDALSLEDLGGQRFCLAIEDSAATAVFLAEREVAPVVLLDRPWNRHETNGKIRRVRGWEDLADLEP